MKKIEIYFKDELILSILVEDYQIDTYTNTIEFHSKIKEIEIPVEIIKEVEVPVEVIKELGRSPRFKDLKVTDFVRNNELENEKQFSAIVIHLPKNEICPSN